MHGSVTPVSDSPRPRSRPPMVYAFAFEYVDVAADFPGRAAKQEIVLIKFGDLLEPLDIAQSQSMVGQRNQLVPPHLLQDAVDMHRGQAKRVGEFGLCQRQLDRIILTQPNRPQPPHQLAEQIGDAPACAPPSESDDAFAVDRLLLQRAPP